MRYDFKSGKMVSEKGGKKRKRRKVILRCPDCKRQIITGGDRDWPYETKIAESSCGCRGKKHMKNSGAKYYGKDGKELDEKCWFLNAPIKKTK